MKKQQIALEAKHLCRKHHSGVLSTHSSSVSGYPFGSVTPFLLTPEGDPIIYISDLAQHTHNIKQNSKVSLIVYDTQAEDSQASGRVTILGDAEICDDEVLQEQYRNLFQQSKDYQKTHDFNFYRINTVKVRFIGGFGKIYWLHKEQWNAELMPWQEDISGMVSHMNIDHQDAMRLMVLHHYGQAIDNLEMVSAFQEGTHFRDGTGKVFFIPFEHFCQDANDVRKELVRLTHLSRQKAVA